jgi:phospholipid-binding lipoprotein MlaA
MAHIQFWRLLCALLLALNIQWVSAQTAPTNMSQTDDVVLTKDPFENFNRGAFQFNDGWDQVLFKPIAKTYQKVVPASGRGCVHGFFDNLGVPYTAVNNILQGKFKAAGQDICRFVVNTTVGVGGCFDVASKIGLPKHDEDFGQTLGKWGVPSGPFVMLPGLGPSTLRDALAKPVDFLADPIGYIQVIKLRNSLRGLKMVDTRTQLLETLEFVDDVALDRYTLMRDAWLQRREAQVRDEDYEPDVAPLSDAVTPAAPAPEAAAQAVEVNAPVQAQPLEPLVEKAPELASAVIIDAVKPAQP